MSIFVQTDSPLEVPCRECGGDGWEPVQNYLGPPERDACSGCDGLQMDFMDLACLGLNLPIAGALTLAFHSVTARALLREYERGYQDACDSRAGC